MIAVDLTPRSRQLLRRHRARIRTWIVCSASYGLFLLIAFIVSMVSGTSDDAIVRTELANVEEELQSIDRSSMVLQERLGRAAEQLDANLAVGNQPDWGILLALLGGTLEEDIALRQVAVHSGTGTPLAPAPTARTARAAEPEAVVEATQPESTHVELNGLGPSPEAISDFVLRLDQIDLFSHVKLIDTKREPFLGRFATGFRVECVLSAAGDAKR